MARAAGVSQATVSRVLNDGHVAAATRARVLEAIEAIGYTPNALARGLVTSSSGLVGVVVSDVANVFYPEVLETIAAQFSAVGLRMLLINAVDLDAADAVRMLTEQKVDAAVFTAALPGSRAVFDLAKQQFPVVLINRDLDAPVDRVISDNRQGAKAAARHLLDLGHRQMGVLTGLPDASTTIDRLGGFQDVLDTVPDIPPPVVIEGQFDYATAYHAVRRLLAVGPRPTALFCHNDYMAFAALNAARAAGVRVPEDLSVIGFDNVRLAAWEAFSLTTVNQAIDDITATAVSLLQSRLVDPDLEPRKVTYPCELIIRSTTAIVRA